MKNLRDLRKMQNISMKELGEILGVSESTISLYENGKRQPDHGMLALMAEYFKTTTDYLLGRTNNSAPTDTKTQADDTKKEAPSEINTEEAIMLAITNMLGRKPTDEELKRFLDMAKLFFNVQDKSSD